MTDNIARNEILRLHRIIRERDQEIAKLREEVHSVMESQSFMAKRDRISRIQFKSAGAKRER